MFKKRKRPRGSGRSSQGIADGAKGNNNEGESAGVVRVERHAKTSRRVASSSSSSGKKEKKKRVMHAFEFQSTRDGAAVAYSGGATAHLQTETAHDRDARALLEKDMARQQEIGNGIGSGEYRGQGTYRGTGILTKDKISSGMVGPKRASVFVRTTSRFDYEPEVCKDYKETGFCGYGDNCIYLHDRGDYLTGWQMEKQWEEKRRKEREALQRAADRDAGDLIDDDAGKTSAETSGNKYPFACHICRGEFKRPIETTCGHFFCESCALKRYKKTSRCAVCGKGIDPIFNAADGLEEALRKRAERSKELSD